MCASRQNIGKRVFQVIVLTVIILSACRRPDGSMLSEDWIPLYTAKEISVLHKGHRATIPVIDTLIGLPSGSLSERLEQVLASVSERYFRGLGIELSGLDSTGHGWIAHVELHERPGFQGPGTLPMWQSWYQYFQGSYQGSFTVIQLEENILQRNYKNDWIDGVVFYYQGEPLTEWDHVSLSGTRYRHGNTIYW